MSSQPLHIFQYWHDEEVPDYVAELTQTFAHHNPDLPHRVYSEAGAEELIATHFGQRELDCFRACAVPAMQADYFRYCALLALGGIYADVDYRCTGSLRPLIEDGGDALLLRFGDDVSFGGVAIAPVANGLLLFKQSGHPLLELTLSMATAQIEATIDKSRVGRSAVLITGPVILSGLRLAHDLGSLEALTDLFAGTQYELLGARLRETIGDHERVTRAFEGVRLVTIEEWGVIAEADRDLPYKSTETHWINHRAAIYRSTG